MPAPIISPKPLRICFDRVIPGSADDWRKKIAASRVLRGQRRPTLDADAPGPVRSTRLALIKSRMWANGQTLKCRFMAGTTDQKAGVIHYAKQWMTHANLNIEFVKSGKAQVRIQFDPDEGSWSAVGRDAENVDYFPADGPTMNYGWLNPDTTAEEYQRVVLHEFGHAIGCIHEAQNPNVTLDWNEDAVYEAFGGPPNNWSPEEIEANILQKYGPKGISATSFDRLSIMLYQFDASLFKNGVATPNNTDLSTKDKAMIRKVYPFPPGTEPGQPATKAPAKKAVKKAVAAKKAPARAPAPEPPTKRVTRGTKR